MKLSVNTKYDIGDWVKVISTRDWSGCEFRIERIRAEIEEPPRNGARCEYAGMVNPQTRWSFSEVELEGVVK